MTLLSVGVSAGFSLAGLLGPGSDDSFAGGPPLRFWFSQGWVFSPGCPTLGFLTMGVFLTTIH
jgi:hypothetical protein